MQIVARNALGSAQGFQVIEFADFAGNGVNVVARLLQNVDGDAADAAGRSGHHDGAIFRFLAESFHAVQAKSRGETGRTQGHAVAQRETFGDRHDALAVEALILGVTTIANLRKAGAGHQHLVTLVVFFRFRRYDRARHVDAAAQGIPAQDFPLARRGQSILVVDAGIGHLDGDVALVEVIDGDVFDTRAITVGIIVNTEGFEGLGSAGHVECVRLLGLPRR